MKISKIEKISKQLTSNQKLLKNLIMQRNVIILSNPDITKINNEISNLQSKILFLNKKYTKEISKKFKTKKYEF